MSTGTIVLIYAVISLALYAGGTMLQQRAKEAGKSDDWKRIIPLPLWYAICVLGFPWLLLHLLYMTSLPVRKPGSAGSRPAAARPAPAPSQCSYLYDAGDYGGVRYWCENTTAPGLFGKGTRVPINSSAQLSQYCRGSFTSCPMYSKPR